MSNLLLAWCRSNVRVAIVVASSGLAALTLHGGTTAHSRFKIPMAVNSNTILGVKKQSHLAALFRAADFFIWDECSMIRNYAIDAVDRMSEIFAPNRVVFSAAKPFSSRVI